MEKENNSLNEIQKVKTDIIKRYNFSFIFFLGAIVLIAFELSNPNIDYIQKGLNNLILYTSFILLIISVIASLGPNYVLYGKVFIAYKHIPALISEKYKLDTYLLNKNNKIYLDTANPKVQNKIENSIESSLSHEEMKLIQFTDNCTNRFTSEIQILNRKGQVNLWIGITTTIIGASILSYTFITAPNTSQDHWTYLIHFFIRISIIIFFEFFAFFFLRLYKNIQEDIKYYQNEISNIELKTFAAMTALASNDTSLLKPIIEQLAATERNFILKKGETTIGLEREKLDKNEIIDLVRETIISTQHKSKNK
ncbi:hypothetical protein [Commensalibacter papalotli (ex Servin-Garciduenas et al. 2014)]|uniref:Uncharacterized protein n=1 Tax=Commensalibacter papalotli (ex Servin-Garciduenas et al. 2014) TaxID=1208583 RepID=W7E321_9PROT|nr:hypothetical protein [Commensalibacter papalotli (ex Servin-Garciduenas et al. 2014)]EUK17456.1 hypothetical protein COMX_10215 [Commensalibacter papalotli (ex Servin-Garciduenas et al. 2014)]